MPAAGVAAATPAAAPAAPASTAIPPATAVALRIGDTGTAVAKRPMEIRQERDHKHRHDQHEQEPNRFSHLQALLRRVTMMER